MHRVAVIDYGMGNLRSVSKAVEHVAAGQAEVVVTDDHALIESADRVVFPGQGAARDCMREIHARDLTGVIRESIENKPFLGICMGMQVLLERSEEHLETDCLGVLPGMVRSLAAHAADAGTGARLSIPQMGWNQVQFCQRHPLWAGVKDGAYFYFANSYYADPDDAGVVAGRTAYGLDFASAIARDNVFATQFHPEKSAKDGLQILSNFLDWDGTL